MNVSPIGALGLFAGTYARGRLSWTYPLAALTLYVLSLGAYPLLVLASVYLGFALPAVIGATWLRGRVRAPRVLSGSLLASALFFLISNAGNWLVYGVPRGESLAFHYGLGLPLLLNTLAGDLTFTTLLFGGYAWAARQGARRPGQRTALGAGCASPS